MTGTHTNPAATIEQDHIAVEFEKSATVAQAHAELLRDPETAQAVARLDHVFLKIRRAVAHPDALDLPAPSLGRTVDAAKVLACTAIAELQESGAPTVSAVAEALGLEHSTASRLLTESESEGLLVRGQDPADRRRTVVELTADGKALVADSTQIRRWLLCGVLTDWGTGDIERMAELLERFEASLMQFRDTVLAAAVDKFCPAAAGYAGTHPKEARPRAVRRRG